MPTAKRGMEIKDVSYEDELFNPTITQTADRKVYLVVGKEYSSVLRLDELNTIRRRDFGTVTVSAASIADLPEKLLEKPQWNSRKTLQVAIGETAPVVDGDLADWSQNEESWATLDARTSGALKIANGRLYGAFRTGDAGLLQNIGTQSAYLFKGGGSLDVMLVTRSGEDHSNAPVAGDLRLLVTRVGGAPRATLYRAVSPDAPENSKVEFVSPVGRVVFDEVKDVSAGILLVDKEGNYEFSIALKTLNWEPGTGNSYRGDLGLLRGNAGQTVQRLYWSNTDTAIVSDVPSEAKLQPGNWGIFKIQ